jgi:hypothetical protein
MVKWMVDNCDPWLIGTGLQATIDSGQTEIEAWMPLHYSLDRNSTSYPERGRR